MSGAGLPENPALYGSLPNSGIEEDCLRRVKYLYVNSKDRENLSTTEPNSYTVKFNEEFRNIESVRLLSATLPDINNVTIEPFLFMDIAELNDRAYTNYGTTDPSGNIFFDILQLSDNVSSSNNVFFRAGVRMMYRPFISRLDRMTISIYDQSHTLFDFGSDVESYLLARQNSFVFEIVEVVKNDRRIPRHLVMSA